jgi:hypothetical protein
MGGEHVALPRGATVSKIKGAIQANGRRSVILSIAWSDPSLPVDVV